MYVINTTQGTMVIRRSFACTRNELPRELATAARIPLLELIRWYSIHGDQCHMTDADLIAIYHDPHRNMRTIRVEFENSDFNYCTTINGTRKDICDYFRGARLDVGYYPVENMQTPIAIAFADDDGTIVRHTL